LGEGAFVGYKVSILARADIQPNWTINYEYHVSGYLVDGEIIIQMSCFTRTLQEWEDDFWNNDEEFPEGSPQGRERLRAFNKMKAIMLMEEENGDT
jgi:hypothetical protein